jgi:type II secretory pathway component PulF
MRAYRVSVCVSPSAAQQVAKHAGGTFKVVRRKKFKTEAVITRQGLAQASLGEFHRELLDCTYMTAAVDAGDAMRQALSRGWSVTGTKEIVRHYWQREVVGKEYKLSFLRALSFYGESMTPSRALMTVIKAETHAGIRHELDAALRILEVGGQFSDAIGQIAMFDISVVSILVAGEKTGSLRQAITSAAEHYELSTKTRTIMFGILTALSIDLFTSISTAITIQTTGLSWFAEQATEIKDAVKKAAFLHQIELSYWINGAALIAATVVGMAAAVAVFQGLIPAGWPGRQWIEDATRRMPLFAKYFVNQEVADTFKVASVMLCGGVALDKTVLVTRNASTTLALRNYWDGVTRRLGRGDSVVASIADDALILDGERQMIAAHQSAAQLGFILGKIAEARGGQAQMNAKSIRTAMMVGVVGFGIYTALLMIWLLMAQGSILGGISDAARGN